MKVNIWKNMFKLEGSGGSLDAMRVPTIVHLDEDKTLNKLKALMENYW